MKHLTYRQTAIKLEKEIAVLQRSLEYNQDMAELEESGSITVIQLP